jgi:hypothetical protein
VTRKSDATPDANGRNLRPATVVALALLLVAWAGWKVWKLDFFWRSGLLSWQFFAVTILGVAVFFVLLAGILWVFERGPREGDE